MEMRGNEGNQRHSFLFCISILFLIIVAFYQYFLKTALKLKKWDTGSNWCNWKGGKQGKVGAIISISTRVFLVWLFF